MWPGLTSPLLPAHQPRASILSTLPPTYQPQLNISSATERLATLRTQSSWYKPSTQPQQWLVAMTGGKLGVLPSQPQRIRHYPMRSASFTRAYTPKHCHLSTVCMHMMLKPKHTMSMPQHPAPCDEAPLRLSWTFRKRQHFFRRLPASYMPHPSYKMFPCSLAHMPTK